MQLPRLVPSLVTVALLVVRLTSTGLAQSTGAAPSLDELRNLTYSGFSAIRVPVHLTNGRWESVPDRLALTFVGHLRATGDLNGDGVDEAAVLLAEGSAGSGERIYLAVVAHGAPGTAGGPKNIATILVGPNVKVRRMAVVAGAVSLDVLQVGPHDAMCCPSELATRTFTLNGTSLHERPVMQTGMLSPETMGGTDWVLRAVDFNVPAPASPPVTLRFEDGTFMGRSGCNKYSASVTAGDRPGLIAVGNPITTRMACAPAAMALEARFLKQLHGVSHFTFLAGQLTLIYDPKGQGGQMLFDPVVPR